MRLFSLLFLIVFSTIFTSPMAAQDKLVRELNIRKTLSPVSDRNVILSKPNQAELKALGLRKEGNATFFRIDPVVIHDIIQEHPDLLRLKIPYGIDGAEFEVVLYNKNPYVDNAIVRTSDGSKYQMTNGAYYRGVIEGEEKSLVALSFFEGEMSGIVSSIDKGQYDIGKTDKAGIHVSYDSQTLPFKNNFKCGTKDEQSSMMDNIENELETRDAGDCVKIFMEASYKIYQNKGSVANVETFINGFFNVVATLYDNEDVPVAISEIFVWTTQDPFPTNDSGDALDFYTDYRTSFNGDLAHLLAKTNNGNGGIAWLNALCNNSIKYSYADINMTYSNFPNYSWTVEVVTHELGHNIGSSHTQSCSWPGGAIDNCYETEGSCGPGPAPVNGGTIMSYCHLTNYGINFANGFGPLPGNKIRERIIAKQCLGVCGPQCPTFVITGAPIPLSCFGVNNGSILLNAPTVGQAPYTYLWSNGATSKDIYDLAPGTYNVTITDANNCPGTQSFIITAPSLLTSNGDQSDITCFGLNNGTISLNTNGGTPNYSYLWSNGMVTSNIANLAPGNYFVTITDTKNCSLEQNFLIQQPTPLIINESIGNITCFAENDGLISVIGTGGTGGIFYAWNTGANGNFINNLGAGSYSVTITDANQCESTESYLLSEPSILTAAVVTTPATSTLVADGTAEAFVSGGTPNYSYSWSNGASTSKITNLAVGSYSVTITDSHDCETIQYFIIDAPDCQLTANLVSQPVTCAGGNNGSATANISNPVGSVNYTWSNGMTNQTISNLSVGTYSVTITDNACSVIKTVVVNSPAPILVTSSFTAPACNIPNGSISVNAAGGVGNYSYQWSNGSTNQNLNSIPAGTYTVTITDQNQCSTTFTQNLIAIDNVAPIMSVNNAIVYLNENGQGDLNSFSTNYFFTDNCGLSSIIYNDNSYDCSDLGNNISTMATATDMSGNTGSGVISILVLDTISPVVICPGNLKQGICQGPPVWDDITYSDNCSIQGITQVSGFVLGTIFPLGVTTNTFVITDNSGNETTCSFDVTITAGLSLSLKLKDMACNNVPNGSAEVDVNNITPPYQINWSTGETTPKIINLGEGSYSVTVTDGNNCSFTDVFNIVNPLPISMTVVNIINATSSGASDGAIEIQVTGGNPGYVYEWTKDNVIVSTEKDPKGLAAGIYKVVIRDKNGCTVIGVEITVGIALSSNHWTLDPLFIYPNPANSTININSKSLKDCVITIYDVLGRKMDVPMNAGKDKHSIDVDNLSNGTYIIRVEKNDQWFVSKVVISH